MKTKTILLVAVATLTMSNQLFGQNENNSRTISQSHSHSHSHSHSNGVNVDVSYSYDYSYEIPHFSVSGGLKLNSNLSNFSMSYLDNYQSNMKLGGSFGGFLKIDFFEYFAMQFELMISHKNSELENKNTGVKQDYRYWGTELPMYLIGQMNLGSGKGFIGVGPYVSAGFNAVYKPNNINLYKGEKKTDDAIMERWDFGLGAVLGYEFQNGIIVNAGYQQGLINILSAQKDDFTMRNQTLFLGIGYKF